MVLYSNAGPLPHHFPLVIQPPAESPTLVQALELPQGGKQTLTDEKLLSWS